MRTSRGVQPHTVLEPRLEEEEQEEGGGGVMRQRDDPILPPPLPSLPPHGTPPP